MVVEEFDAIPYPQYERGNYLLSGINACWRVWASNLHSGESLSLIFLDLDLLHLKVYGRVCLLSEVYIIQWY